MASFMTLTASCEACDDQVEVFADQLFEFDCRCAECGGVLIIHEEEGGKEDGDEAPTAVYSDPPTREDSEEPRAELDPSRYDRPTKADTEEDPYAAAALALDPTSARYRRPNMALFDAPVPEDEVGDPAPAEDDPLEDTHADVVPEHVERGEDPYAEENRATQLLDGTQAKSSPLPSWDGGDTQQVQDLAQSEPALVEATPVDVGGDPLADAATPEDLGQLAPVVEVVQSTSGRGSRSYDASEVLGPDAADKPPTAPLGSAEAVAAAVDDTAEPEEEAPRTGTGLFGEDLDWLALLDESLPEPEAGGQDEDEGGRVVIRIPEEAAPSEEDLRQAIKSLDSGEVASLGSLITGGLSDSRTAQRFADPDKSELPGQATAVHVRAGSDEPPTAPHKPVKGDTSTTQPWSVVEANQDQPTADWGSDPADPKDEPTRRWGNETMAAARQVGDETPPSGTVREAPSSGRARRGEPPSSGAARRPPPSSDRMRREPPSSGRKLRRSSDSHRTIDNFSVENLDPALVCAREQDSPEADHFRQLYQQIFLSRNGSSPQMVLVTSPRRGEGKTTIAANLAIAGAGIPGHGVLLVDADPRGRGVLRAFGERSPMEGLLEALETGSDPQKSVIQFNLHQMDVIPLGIRGSRAAELISSDHMAEFLRSLRQLYPDWSIIVDASSVLTSADPLVLSQHVDGVVLVVRAGTTPEDELSRVTDLIGRKKVLGVVLNDARLAW